MRHRSLLGTALFTLLASHAVGAEQPFPDFPQSGFVLLDSTVIAEPDMRFTSSTENGYLVLKSSLSPQWRKGVYLNPQNGRVTVPGVGAANLEKNDKGYTWTTSTVDVAFEKQGSMTWTRLAQGCEMVWKFYVISRGQRLVNESGRLGYACSTGAPQANLAKR